MSENLTRLTVNLTEAAMHCLEIASKETGDSKTDVVNRALQVYSFALLVSKPGIIFYVKDLSKGTFQEVKFE